MKKLLLCAFAMLLVASAASAAVLWDQSNLKPNGEGSVNLASNGCSQISGNTRAHNTSDVTFAQPVQITSISIWESAGNVQAATQAYLSIFPYTGPVPGVPSDSLYNTAKLVPIIVSAPALQNGLSSVKVTATWNRGPLPAGSYWVSLTPRHNLGIFPYSVHHVTEGPIVGQPTRVIDACTVNSNWLTPLNPPSYDYSLRIEGNYVEPTPTASTSWGRMKMLYR
jgi:hypothetical protein